MIKSICFIILPDRAKTLKQMLFEGKTTLEKIKECLDRHKLEYELNYEI